MRWSAHAPSTEHGRQGGGAIVNQSSTAAWLYANHYGLAKVGINGLTQQLSRELGWQNIRINAIAPGPIDTEANRTTTPAAMVDDIVKRIRSTMGQTEDLVGMVCSCLRIRQWITGQIFNVDWRTDHPAMITHDMTIGYIGLRQHGRPDGHAFGRLARRADGVRRTTRR